MPFILLGQLVYLYGKVINFKPITYDWCCVPHLHTAYIYLGCRKKGQILDSNDGSDEEDLENGKYLHNTKLR